MESASAIHGALLGTIIGDAMGLPYEALSRRRGERLLGTPDRQRFVFGRGMMSDDGEHACMVAQALCSSGGDVERFRRSLAWRLRWWVLGVPAGIGGATLRAVLKLWVGFTPERSGVYSAGNGPAMRSAMLGAAVSDPAKLRELVWASTVMTHTDPKAFYGAMAVAVAARCAADGEVGDLFLERCRSAFGGEDTREFIEALQLAVKSAADGESTPTFAGRIGCERDVSGYIYKAVPVAIHAWLRHPADYAAAVSTVILCGGDTDTVAAIAGGIVGGGVGVEGIPTEWRERLLEWPRTAQWVERVASAANIAVADGRVTASPRVGPLVLFRNFFFVLVVFVHLGRRALPPY